MVRYSTAQFRNFDGHRYFKSLEGVTKKKAMLVAKQKRDRGLHARVSPDSKNRGYYAVYTKSKKKGRK